MVMADKYQVRRCSPLCGQAAGNVGDGLAAYAQGPRNRDWCRGVTSATAGGHKFQRTESRGLRREQHGTSHRGKRLNESVD